MTQIADERLEQLARGDGAGLVPVDVATELWNRGLTRFEPTPRSKPCDVVFVRLTDEAIEGVRGER
jgi:hypothetical protein